MLKKIIHGSILLNYMSLYTKKTIMNTRYTKVVYDKPTRTHWIKEFVISLISLSFFKGFIRLIGYYWVNCIASRRHVKIGKGSNIHPTVIFRQPERISIGNNC